MPMIFPAQVQLTIDNNEKDYELSFSVCESSRCKCNGVHMLLEDSKDEISFFLDFTTDSYRDANYSQEEIKTIKALIDYLKARKTEINLDFFKDHFAYVKKAVKNKQNAIKSLAPGVLMLYRDIMWKDKDIKINIDGKSFLVFDGYCVTPNCNCKDAGLYFFEEDKEIDTPDFSFIYEYGANSYRELINLNNAEAEKIISLLPDVFEERHNKIKQELKKTVERKMKRFIPIKKRKLGRNEPCHCESGVKYKKCCMDKDLKSGGIMRV